MPDGRMALMEALQKADDGNFPRSRAETVLQLLLEADVEGATGAGRCERSSERATRRNGCRDRSLDTRLGQPNLRIPKRRTGTCFPPFLEARKTTETALISVIEGERANANGPREPANGIAGVSTRKVDDPVQAMWLGGISRARYRSLARRSTSRAPHSRSGRSTATGLVSGSMRPA